MKTIKSLMAVAMLAVGIGATVMPNTASAEWSQSWELNGVSSFGSFDAIGMSRVFGVTFANPALTLDQVTPGWTERSNSHDAFASFTSTTDLLFTNHLLSDHPGNFVFYVWNEGALVTSALCNVTGGAFSCSGFEGSRTPGEQFILSAPVPEPETYAMMLAGLGLMGFIARRRRERDAV
jgi:hypothetical protein